MSDLVLSPQQEQALRGAAAWYAEVGPEAQISFCDDKGHFPYPHTHAEGQAGRVFAIGGLAGTGKTTIARLIEQHLGARAVFGTPTHRAAGVLRGKLGAVDEEAAKRVRTYHSMTYYARPYHVCSVSGQSVKPLEYECRCGADDARTCECPQGFEPCDLHRGAEALACSVKEQLSFERREFLGGWRDLVIIDESSMLTQQQVEDVRSFGVPVLLIGDHGQLPPVKAEMNPWMLHPDVELTEVHRQGAGSGILRLARLARVSAHRDRIPLGAYGIDGDTVVISLSHPDALALLDPRRFPPGPDRIIIAWTNKMRATLNTLFHGDGPLREGDRLVSLQTHDAVEEYHAPAGTLMKPTGRSRFVANGMTGTVVRVLAVGPRTADVLVHLDGGEDEQEADTGLYVRLATEQLANPETLANNARPRGAQLWDYAYAVTAHKAQGGEYKHVIVIDQAPADYPRWLYTAVTRAKERLVVIQWRKGAETR